MFAYIYQNVIKEQIMIIIEKKKDAIVNVKYMQKRRINCYFLLL